MKKEISFSAMLQKSIDKINKRHDDELKAIAEAKQQQDGTIDIFDLVEVNE